MINKLRAAIAAIAVVSTAPASAALFTYDFTAGGESVYTYGSTYQYSCGYGGGNCTSNNVQDGASFTLNGSFTVDTSKLPVDQIPGNNGFYFDTYGNQSAEAQFLSGTMTKTGGTLPMPSGTGGSRSYLYGYDAQQYGGGSSFQVYAQSPSSSLNYQYQYRSNGSLERVYYRDEYITFYVDNSLPDVGTFDGFDFATAFASAIADGYAQMGYYLYDALYDENGAMTSFNETSHYSQARLTSLNAAPGGPTEVPEPAMLGLFGLGIAGLAMGRRRKAA